jgi:hypothetical protein
MDHIIQQEEKNRIDDLCKEFKIENYTINDDKSIDVVGNVRINHAYSTPRSLPLSFGKVLGDFDCSLNGLTTLIGCPVSVSGSFACSQNSLSSLEYCPNEVGNDFKCSHNILSTLEYCPKKIGGNLECHNNWKLTSLKGCPDEVGGYVNCVFTKIPNEYHALENDEKKIFIGYQHYYDIWTPEFSEENMNGLIAEIKDGLK